MAPGPLLATVLEAITGEDGSGLAALADDQLIGVLSGIRRIEARAAWGQLAVLAELARRRPATGDPRHRGQYGFSEFAPDEVAGELRLSVQSAAGQMMYAVARRRPAAAQLRGAVGGADPRGPPADHRGRDPHPEPRTGRGGR